MVTAPSVAGPVGAGAVSSRSRARVGWEIALVLGLTFGRSGVYAVWSLVERLTRPVPLGQQTTSMNTAATPDRAWLSLLYEVADVIFPLA
ncbi:MAG: hypothetical protein LBL55_02665, partial [Propionibacteriaceae bacterium]|nr:hypothetical protein [Propionibacteriaceae bacterium]